ncbi:MAG: hypothetical protein WC785_02105 [Tatlockia sp.]
MFLRLERSERKAIAKELSHQSIPLLLEGNRVNAAPFLPFLWPKLDETQKKSLSCDVLPLFKVQGINLINQLPRSDMDLIFKNFDLATLPWEWKNIQLLLGLFSEAECKIHIKNYFKPYIDSYNQLKPIFDGKLKTFLDALSEEECCWIFMKMDYTHFLAFLDEVDFLFDYFSSKNRALLLTRLNSASVFNLINTSMKKSFLSEKLSAFLNKFDGENRREVLFLMEPKQLHDLIYSFLCLITTIKLLPETERLLLLQYLGYEHLKALFLCKPGLDCSYYLYSTNKLLPSKDRVSFLKGFDKEYLDVLLNKWDTAAWILNELPSNDDEKFLDYVKVSLFSIFNYTMYSLRALTAQKRFLFLSKMENEKLIEFLYKEGIKNILEALPDENRYDFITLLLKCCPDVLTEIFSKLKSHKIYFLFNDLTLLLPKKHRFSFFALFSEQSLNHVECNYMSLDEKVIKTLKDYLIQKNKVSSAIVVKNPINVPKIVPQVQQVAVDSALPDYVRRNEELVFDLFADPHLVNHYEYIKTLLKLPPRKPWTGPIYSSCIPDKLQSVAWRLEQKKQEILNQSSLPHGRAKEEYDLACLHIERISLIQTIFAAPNALAFYDLTLNILHSSVENQLILASYDVTVNIPHSSAENQCILQMGGRKALLAYARKDPELTVANAVFLLQSAHCLTPANFKKLTICPNPSQITSILFQLAPVKLITEANFNLLMQNQDHAEAILNGLCDLSSKLKLNQQLVTFVVSAGKEARRVSIALERVIDPVVGALNWKAPEELRDLNQCIDQMLNHGFFLLNQDRKRGEETILLALELKQILKTFFEEHPSPKPFAKIQLNEQFLKKLHSKDKEMACHRQQWKVIVANIAVALTGVGLVVVGASYLFTGHGLFSQTRREKCIKSIEHSAQCIYNKG